MPGRSPRTASLLPLIAGLLLAIVVVAVIANRDGDGAETAAPVGERSTPTTPRAATPPASTTTSTLPPDRQDGWVLRGGAARRVPVPILMYHQVATAPAGTAYPDLWVPVARFREQVAALRRAGFTAVTMGEVWSAWHGNGALPRRPIVLSFDDGALNQVMNAAPVLLDAGWPGVLNLTVQNLGPDGLPLWGARRMIRQGWEIGSHTVTHPDLTTLGPDALRREMAQSRRQIRDRLGVDPRFVCYPAGRNDPGVRAAAAAAGYHGATTVDPGLARRGHDPFLLPRVRVQPATTAADLVRMASAAG